MDRGQVIVFAGPTLARPTGRAPLAVPPGFALRPPVQRGDVLAALAEHPETLVLLDGYYYTVPAVTHKEILYALDAGVRVIGAASLGALRAAELAPFGMIGVGRVFADYREGRLDGDDEVALLHAPAEQGYRPLTVALVEVRHALPSIDGSEGLLAALKGLPFIERTPQRLEELARSFLGEAAARELQVALARGGVKEEDAREALALAAEPAPLRPPRRRPAGRYLTFDKEAALRGPAPSFAAPGATESRLRRDPHPLAPSPTRTHTRPGEGEPESPLPLEKDALGGGAPLPRGGSACGRGDGGEGPGEAGLSAPATRELNLASLPPERGQTLMDAWRMAQILHPGAVRFIRRLRLRQLLAEAALRAGCDPSPEQERARALELQRLHTERYGRPLLPRPEYDEEARCDLLAAAAASLPGGVRGVLRRLAGAFGIEDRSAVRRLERLFLEQPDLLPGWWAARAFSLTPACAPALRAAAAAGEVHACFLRRWSGARVVRDDLWQLAADLWGCVPAAVPAEGARRGLFPGFALSGGLREALERIAAAERLPEPINRYREETRLLASTALHGEGHRGDR